MTMKDEGDVFRALYATESGRLFCGLLMRETGVFSPGARMTPEQTYLCEGERNVGLRIFNGLLSAGEDPLKSINEFDEWVKLLAKSREENSNE